MERPLRQADILLAEGKAGQTINAGVHVGDYSDCGGGVKSVEWSVVVVVAVSSVLAVVVWSAWCWRW